MAKIDIRNEQLGKVEVIIFSDGCGLDGSNWAVDLQLIESRLGNHIRIAAEDGNNSLGLQLGDAQNLIKALQKAVEIGWTK
jgi:hypothetical protein